MAEAPVSLNIRAYHVGFGDCFLLSFKYTSGEKHVLVDFGSTGLPPGTPKTRMMDIAKDIKSRSGGKLTAVVATHRHKDHISGFTTSGGKGTGDIIAGLKPDLVTQPWTEEPGLAKTATGPSDGSGAKVAALANMQAIAAHATTIAKRMSKTRAPKDQVTFIGDDNIANPLAVRNLATMGAKAEYLYCGAKSGLGALLPGVTVNVLGPPTVKQSDAIKKERSKDPNEFWQFQSDAMATIAASGNRTPALFPRFVKSRGPTFPVEVRWLVLHARSAMDDQTLQIVRMLDDAMNNTSVILLMQVGSKSLLFPGDAQIENWQYALGQAKYKALLANVNLYKVGHHGSLNATPKSLWALFKNKSDKPSPRRMASLMSTMPGKHGSVASHTEVPRQTLKAALQQDTNLFTTESLTGAVFYKDTAVTF